MKNKLLILILTMFCPTLIAQTFYFDPYLALSGEQGELKLSREMVLEMMKQASFRKELEDTLMVDIGAFVRSGTSKFISYDEYVAFLIAQDMNNITGKSFMANSLISNCEYLTTKNKSNTFTNLRVQNTFRGRLLSNQLDMALEEL